MAVKATAIKKTTKKVAPKVTTKSASKPALTTEQKKLVEFFVEQTNKFSKKNKVLLNGAKQHIADINKLINSVHTNTKKSPDIIQKETKLQEFIKTSDFGCKRESVTKLVSLILEAVGSKITLIPENSKNDVSEKIYDLLQKGDTRPLIFNEGAVIVLHDFVKTVDKSSPQFKILLCSPNLGTYPEYILYNGKDFKIDEEGSDLIGDDHVIFNEITVRPATKIEIEQFVLSLPSKAQLMLFFST